MNENLKRYVVKTIEAGISLEDLACNSGQLGITRCTSDMGSALRFAFDGQND